MRPSQAMALFLLTWRAEWAGLSREQLARQVSSQMRRPEAVTVSVVRKWESGQPPKSLEELEALLAVMHRHWVTEPEVGQFRDAVLAACIDRHYDGLFSDEPVPPTAELGELALWGQPTWNMVAIVARLHELAGYAANPPLRPPPRLVQLRWQEARCLLLGLAAHLHSCARRHRAAARALSEAGDLLEESFGPRGLGVDRTVARQRANEAQIRAHGLHEPGAGDHMLELALACREQGDLRQHSLSLPTAIWALACADPPAYPQSALPREIDQAVGYLGEHCSAHEVAEAHYTLCHALIAEGDLRAAERHLPLVEPIAAKLPSVWPWTLGCFAFATGGYDEAAGHFERARELSLAMYGDWVADSAAEWLLECDRAQGAGLRLGKGRLLSGGQEPSARVRTVK